MCFPDGDTPQIANEKIAVVGVAGSARVRGPRDGRSGLGGNGDPDLDHGSAWATPMRIYGETVEFLDIPIGTVVSRISRGRRPLCVGLARLALTTGDSASVQPDIA